VDTLISGDSVESYLAKELLSDSSNTNLVKNILSKLNKEQLVDLFVDYLSKGNKGKEEVKIPVSLFKAKKLSSFEIVVRFLKDNIGLKNIDISKFLFRSQQTIFNTYKNSKKKFSGKLEVKASEYDIPISIFQNKGSILKSIIVFLKEKHNLRFSEIAKLINRDQRTVWTVYNRKKKRKNNLILGGKNE